MGLYPSWQPVSVPSRCCCYCFVTRQVNSSSFFLQFIHPPAAGGGTPEVIAFLNGIIVHGSLSLKNLVVKFTANVFAVSSGLPAAIQAPIITYGYDRYQWSLTDYELVILALRTCTCLQAKIYQHVSFAVFHSLLITYFWNVPT